MFLAKTVLPNLLHNEDSESLTNAFLLCHLASLYVPPIGSIKMRVKVRGKRAITFSCLLADSSNSNLRQFTVAVVFSFQLFEALPEPAHWAPCQMSAPLGLSASSLGSMVPIPWAPEIPAVVEHIIVNFRLFTYCLLFPLDYKLHEGEIFFFYCYYFYF